MNHDFLYRTNLQYEVKSLRKQVADFESGGKYVDMQKEHRRVLAAMERQMEQMKKEPVRAHAEIIDVRNKWFQACEDVVKEKEKELAGKDRELCKMKEALFKAQGQRDEALVKYRDKNVELYEVKTQLLEAQGKLLELTARMNRDYTNSSKPSSQSPNHKKIHNRREKTGRRPGGQPGHSLSIPAKSALSKEREIIAQRLCHESPLAGQTVFALSSKRKVFKSPAHEVRKALDYRSLCICCVLLSCLEESWFFISSIILL